MQLEKLGITTEKRRITKEILMKKWNLLAAVFQILVGIAAIITYIVIAAAGEPLGKWTVTLILAIAFVVMGVINAIDYVKLSKNQK